MPRRTTLGSGWRGLTVIIRFPVAGCRLRRGWDGASPVLNVPGDRELLDWVRWLGGAETRGVFVCQNHWRDAELGGRG